MPRTRARWLVAAAAALTILIVLARPYFIGFSFVVRAAGLHGVVRRVADVAARRTIEQSIDIPTRRGTLRGRVYSPDGVPRRTALLVSGLHPAGIDEPRLVTLARQLAASRVAVVTPDIPELTHFEITPMIADDMEDAAAWLSTSSSVREGDGRIGLMGISFSGGIAVVAAARPSLAGKVAYVLAFGGHDDLPRVLQYLCGGTGLPERQRETRPPHDYGVAILLLGVAERAVPPEQVEPLRAAVRRFLWASHLDRVDKKKADQEFAALRDLAARMPQPSSTLLTYVNDRDVVNLGARLVPYIGAYGGAPALSPSKSPKPTVPVFLLHGTDDNVIPAVESEFLADDLRPHAPVRLLLSGLISHAEADRPVRVGDVVDLARFWADLLQR